MKNGNVSLPATLPVTKLFEKACEEDLGNARDKVSLLRGICAKNALETSGDDAECQKNQTSWRNIASYAWLLWVKLPDNADVFKFCLNANADYLNFGVATGSGQSRAASRIVKLVNKVPSQGVDEKEVRMAASHHPQRKVQS